MMAAQGIEAGRTASGESPEGRSSMLSGWGREPMMPGREVHPSSLREVPACLADLYQPRGLGRSYGDAGLPAAGHLAVNSGYLDRFLAFDPATGVLEAEAGVSLD